MNSDIDLKKEADRLMHLEGNTKGVTLETHGIYIKHREGQEGLRAVEEKMKELGYPLKFKEINPLKWYPEGLGVLVILVAKKLFNWNDKDIFDMGNSAPKYSIVAKLMMKYFLSPPQSFAQAPKYWRRHYDFGSLEAYEFNDEKKYVKIHIKGYKFHPIVCVFYAGYLLRIAQYVFGTDKIRIKETKCIYRGDPYHEFTIYF